MLTVVSNNESYQVVRHNWAREMPDSKMIREDKYPGLWLGAPAIDYVALARSQGVEGERVDHGEGSRSPRSGAAWSRSPARTGPTWSRSSVAREGVGAESTWYQDWRL